MDNQQPIINTNILNKTPKANNGFIYCYTSPSGKKYVGQTIQKLSDRARQGKGYKKCSVFYRAIQKYGFENFQVEILEEAPQELLDTKEKEWIDYLDTQTPNGYNISEGGGGSSKPVYQYDAETGIFLNSYLSLTEAARANGIKTIQYISNCLNKRAKTAHGSIWDFEKYDCVDPQTYFPNDKKMVYAYHLDGTFYRSFESITEAAKHVQGGRNDIRKVIRGELRFSKGYIWTDRLLETVPSVCTGENGSKPVAQIDIETGKIIQIFGSQSEAARALGLPRPTSISKCCVGKQKTAAGYRWEFYDGSTTTRPEFPVG